MARRQRRLRIEFKSLLPPPLRLFAVNSNNPLSLTSSFVSAAFLTVPFFRHALDRAAEEINIALHIE